MIIIFLVFIDQLINYPINRTSSIQYPSYLCHCYNYHPIPILPVSLFQLSSNTHLICVTVTTFCLFFNRPDGEKKAYVRLASDYDALDVANKVK